MENNQNLRMGVRRFSQNRVPDLFKVSDGLLSNLEDFPNKQLPQQGKDINLLSAYYNKKSGNGNFMERIGKLNKKFYNCTDKFVKSKKIIEKLNDDLYLNLFQQIDCYVEEIERLNKKISLNNNQELKKTIEQLNKEISEKKEKIRNYENKLKEKTNNEEKLKKEIESYKRSLIFYKDKIKIGILNRNNLNTYGRDNNLYYKKKLSKHHTSYLSPTPEKKIKSLGNRTKTNRDLLKLDTDINNKENTNEDNEDEEKNNNIIDSGEKNKNVKKLIKPKESVYKFGRESNYYFENRNDYDTYGKDIEEKDDEYEFDSNFDYLRARDKSKTVKSDNNQNEDKLPPEEHSQKFSSGLLSSLAHEIYENKNTENDSNKNLSENNKNISSEAISEKKESSEIDINNKSKTLNIDKKQPNLMKKNIKIKNVSNTSNNTENIKSKIFNQKNNSKTSKTINKNENNDSNNNKTKQAKTATKSKPKKTNKSIEKISNFNDIHTPYVKNKYKQKFDKEKDKEKHTPTSITQASSESTPILQNNNTLPSNQKRGIGYKKIEVNKVNKKEDLNAAEGNKLVKMKKKTDLYNNKNQGYNSMSNLNVFSKYNSSKTNVNKKINEKENNKELVSVLKDVNDDYLKSIEMLRKQEEQIKYMLRFIDLDEN